jgi:Holliday junction resolvase
VRRAAKRDSNEAAIVQALEKLGWQVTRLSMPDGPDLMLAKAGRCVLAEVKTATGKLKPGQVDWHAKWQGPPVLVLRSVDDALAIAEAIEARGERPTRALDRALKGGR